MNLKLGDVLLLATTFQINWTLAEPTKYELLDINGTNYIFHFDGQLRDDAQTFCNKHHARLITFDNQQKWETVMGYLDENGYTQGYIWTAGILNAKSSNWIWDQTGGQTITEFFWAQNEPSMENAPVSGCIFFHARTIGPRSGRWYDDDCVSYQLAFMCEFLYK